MDLRTRLDSGQVSDEDHVKSINAINSLRDIFFALQLELKIAQSTFLGFQSYENRFDSCEELKVARTAKNAAMTEFKRLRKKVSPLLNKKKKDPNAFTWTESEDLNHYQPLYMRAYAAKCYFVFQYESVQCRNMARLLRALEQQGGANEDVIKHEVDRLRQEASEIETPIYNAEKTIRLMKRMQLKSSSSAAAKSGTAAEPVDSTPANWDDDDGTEAAVEASINADLEMIDDDDNNTDE